MVEAAFTSGGGVAVPTLTAAPHEVLALTGGAIGIGLPLAVGAAVAAPDRKVVSLNGDGAAMYTLQALWTLAREALDVTVVVFANNSYRILNIEMNRTGAGQAGPRAARLLGLGDPVIGWVALSTGMGWINSAGAKATSLMSDETNQAGVWQNTYGPEFSGMGGRQSGGQSGDQSSGTHPGSQNNGDDDPPPNPPMPLAPPAPPTPPTLPTGGAPGGGSGGGQSGSGGAAATPKTPAAGGGGAAGGAGGAGAAAGGIPPVAV